MEQILYSRSDDGLLPVRIREESGQRRYSLEGPGGVVVYPSARQLLCALTGHPEARHWPFDRYFRQGRYAPKGVSADFPLLEMVGPGGWALGRPEVLATSGGPRWIRRDSLGIDLQARGKEVAKLLFHGFGSMIHSAGYDPDDVLQEVYKGILIRNSGSCPFDARKASFGHYVHMVCRCVLANYHRKSQRTRSMEQSGIPGWDENGDKGMIDAGETGELVAAAGLEDEAVLEDFMSALEDSPLRGMALRVLPLVRDGYERSEIAAQLGVAKPTVSRALTYIRDQFRRWYAN